MFLYKEMLKHYLAAYENGMLFNKTKFERAVSIRQFYMAYTFASIWLKKDCAPRLIEMTKIYQQYIIDTKKEDFMLMVLKKKIMDDMPIVHRALNEISLSMQQNKEEETESLLVRYYDDCIAGED